ncbi:hypothetical protein GCM10027062_43320 [Nocardioides hungaricus]
MNDLDVLTDRLHELGRRAPVPAADPLHDIRRGRAALRRRHARGAAGVTTALVAVGAVATNVPTLHWPGGGGDTAIAPAGSPSDVASSTPTASPSPAEKDPCTIEAPSPSATGGLTLNENGEGIASTEGEVPELPFENDPEIIAAQRAYQQAAATILDPTGEHIDLTSKFNKILGGDGSWTCDPATGPRLTGTGTKIGWESGDALGLIDVEVALTDEEEKPTSAEERWSAYEGRLPDGVTKARVAEHGSDGGGNTVVVERTDGLTIAVTTAGTWGNNMPPGSPPATDLPGVDELLTLAASPLLTFPGR